MRSLRQSVWWSLVRFLDLGSCLSARWKSRRDAARPRQPGARRRRPARAGRLGPRRLVLETLEPQLLMAAVAYQAYGIDFSPYIAAGEDPRNGPGQVTESELRQRLTAVGPYTRWIRTFGCTGDLQPAGRIIHELGKKAAIEAWIGPNATANQAEIDAVVAQAIQGHADLVIVGSEVLLRNDVPSATLVGYINQVKSRLAAAKVSVPVTTADVYSQLLAHPDVVQAVDAVMAHYYPFWEEQSVETAIAILHRQHQQLKAAVGSKEILVGETGWPSAGETLGAAVPSAENAAYYFENFVSWARSTNVPYFYFEAINEPWKTAEGTLGTNWGIFDAALNLKPGMERVFRGETYPDNWTAVPGPPIYDFAAMPATLTTNLSRFLIAGVTPHADDVVKLNGSPIPAGSKDTGGVFAFTVPLSPGTNALTLTMESATGTLLSTATKTVSADSALSTAGRRLLYVDVVPGETAALPSLDGTVVIDPDRNIVLGLIPGQHVRGISPDGAEVYFEDNTVFSTASHQQLRTLPFSQSIPLSGFVVDPTGRRLYSRNEVVDVRTNVLEPVRLPVDLTTGNAWEGASIPGGATSSPDGAMLYANRPTVRIDTTTFAQTSTGVSGTSYYTSDLAVTPDNTRLVISGYYSVAVYDLNSTPPYSLVKSYPTGDFGGEIGFLGGTSLMVVGSSGNPQNLGGGVFLIDLNAQTVVDSFPLPLADNLVTSGTDNKIFVSAGDTDSLSGKRLGVDELVVGADGELTRTKTIFLGVNQFTRSGGRPITDQIRRIVEKPAAAFTSPGDQASAEGAAITLAIVAPDGNTFSATNLPAGLTIASDTGVISGVIGGQAAGTYDVILVATDPAANYGNGASTQVQFRWTVSDTTMPTIGDLAMSLVANHARSLPAAEFARVFADADGDNLAKLQVVSLPANGTLTLAGAAVAGQQEILAAQLANLAYTPDSGYYGPDSFTWTASDGTWSAGPARFDITVISSPWQNSHDACDVSGEGDVTALDVLLVINRLNAHGSGWLPIPPSGLEAPPPFVDVDGDGSVMPVDALLVINHINRRSSAASVLRPEGEAVAALDAWANVLADIARGRTVLSVKRAADVDAYGSLVDQVLTGFAEEVI